MSDVRSSERAEGRALGGRGSAVFFFFLGRVREGGVTSHGSVLRRSLLVSLIRESEKRVPEERQSHAGGVDIGYEWC